MSAFTLQLQDVTAIWLVLIAHTHEGMARLSSPGWLFRQSNMALYKPTSPRDQLLNKAV